MYGAHRGMPAPNSRLNELLDQIRQEFDNQQNRSGEFEQQSTFVHAHDYKRTASFLAALQTELVGGLA
jgi:hypothetical protein